MTISPWLLLGAFLFGLAAGWLIWGGRGLFPDRAGAAPPGEAGGLDALEAELAAARELAAADAAEADEAAARLDALDAALKRANGRLKLLLRAAGRTSSGS
ncbi:hypothetical protein [Amphiplicatus metriothermophilus]|uniref:Uncharacterized protein n=1 Tax=Amphiplicatus metriothermophilus TaxID=1519374 RepID=A0A239PWG4_9PROT|nr:hypothetical protein [Amphiplicatus metriothermophilus]MBB5519724.1 hypothetical protein [Amphiplicatus metriothermophilus]SNT74286.1 hypothetical protein SAMN06297382_2197 [Amphiplicatus metriothermophilus]